MADIIVKNWQVKTPEYDFRCFWFPGLYLNREQLASFERDINAVNATPPVLNYGFFALKGDKKASSDFLKRSIWCIAYKDGVPCAFVYQYFMGEVDGVPAIHFGLIKFTHHPGKDFIRAPYIALGIGNLLNFGPYYATNVSHLPAIIDMFGDMVHDLYPHFENQSTELRLRYKGVLELLKETYLAPVIGYDLASVCDRSYRVKGAFDSASKGFINNWTVVPKSESTICNLFVKEWLNVTENEQGHIEIRDDLIQIGKVDYRYLSLPRSIELMNTAKVTDVPFSEFRARLARAV